MKLILPLLLLLVALPLAAQTQIPIRICTYNVLNFGDGEEPNRVAVLQTVFQAVDADILVIQGLNDEGGIFAFFNEFVAASSSKFTFSTANDGPDTDIALLMTSNMQYLSQQSHKTSLRDIDEYVITVKGTADTLHVFVAHLTDGDIPADREARELEAIILRTALADVPEGHHRIVAGDLNVHTSDEPAYNMLTVPEAHSGGVVLDPVDRPGSWHDNESFADVHTESPRVREFGGGDGGGLDDRFDFVLLSPSLMDGEYIAGSYTAYGNDGQHFNDSINAMPNENVSSETAQALHDASDHLPVYLDLVFQRQSSGVEGEPAWRHRELDLSMRKP